MKIVVISLAAIRTNVAGSDNVHIPASSTYENRFRRRRSLLQPKIARSQYVLQVREI